MSLYVCSLIRNFNQTIPNDGHYHIVRFPFGSAESYDAWGMHNIEQPDGYTIDTSSWDTDDRSGLIWPEVSGWGFLTAMVYWSNGDYGETRDRFVRDPLSLGTGYDSTATEDEEPTAGGQYKHKCHQIFVEPWTTLGFLVKHSASTPIDIMHAQFKLAIETNVVTP